MVDRRSDGWCAICVCACLYKFQPILTVHFITPASAMVVSQLVVEGAGTPVNLRKELMKNKIDIYPLQGKIYNCGGGGQCGTCAVQVIKGAQNLK